MASQAMKHANSTALHRPLHKRAFGHAIIVVLPCCSTVKTTPAIRRAPRAAASADAAPGAATEQPPATAPRPAEAAVAAAEPWSYKYRRSRGVSLCRTGDTFCAQVEALFQNVLAYPYVPPRIHRRLEKLREVGIDSITRLVEAAANHFGAELALSFFNRAPPLLELDFDALVSRTRAARATLGLAEHEMPLLLRKNPGLLLMEPEELRARYEALPRVCRFTQQQAQALATKYPMILNRRTQALQFMVGQLRHLAGSRSQWQADFDEITPSLMAFVLRDFGDQVRRLEFLASTGEAPGITLREVFKPSNRLFASSHRGFRPWAHAVQQRRRQQAAFAQRAAARAEGAAGGGGGGGGGWAGGGGEGAEELQEHRGQGLRGEQQQVAAAPGQQRQPPAPRFQYRGDRPQWREDEEQQQRRRRRQQQQQEGESWE